MPAIANEKISFEVKFVQYWINIAEIIMAYINIVIYLKQLTKHIKYIIFRINNLIYCYHLILKSLYCVKK